MSEILAGLIYLDTNFFIRAVEGTPEIAAPAQRLIVALRSRAQLAVTSEITFAEVLAPPKAAQPLPQSVKRRAYLDLLLWSKFIGLIPISREILLTTADLRAFAPMKLPDAIHLASAISVGCRHFVSADQGFKGLPADMELVDTDESSLMSLVDKLPIR